MSYFVTVSYCFFTGNDTELALFALGKGNIWVNITGTGSANDENCYVSAEELYDHIKQQNREDYEEDCEK